MYVTCKITVKDLEVREDLFKGGEVAVLDQLLPDLEYESISIGKSD